MSKNKIIRSKPRLPVQSNPVSTDLPIRKIAVRVCGVLFCLWLVALSLSSFFSSRVPVWLMLGTTVLVLGGGMWGLRSLKKVQALGHLLQKADSPEKRKQALETLALSYRAGDSQALLARAQLEMQDDPKQALKTLESIDLTKQLTPIADQVRSMRIMIHLMRGEIAAARPLADEISVEKQQDPKTRALFAAGVAETWARTGEAKKAQTLINLFDLNDPVFAEVKPQLLRAHAFVFAESFDEKGVKRTLHALVLLDLHFLAMFVGQKRMHPLLEREAKQILAQHGMAPQKTFFRSS